MAAVTVHTDCGDQENKVCHCFHFFPIYLPWSDGTKCHDLHFLMLNFKPAFHTPLLSSSRVSLVPLCFLSLGWYHLHIWGCRPFSQKSWFQLVIIQSGISHVVLCNTQFPPQPVPSCLDKPSTSSLQLTEGTGHGKFVCWLRKDCQVSDSGMGSFLPKVYFFYWTSGLTSPLRHFHTPSATRSSTFILL